MRVENRPAISYGTTAFTCVADAYRIGAGIPSNSTRTPPSVVSMKPCGVTCADTGVAGPRSAPKIVAINPGTATDGASEAALTMDLTCGMTGVLTFSVTFTVCGLLLALGLVTLTVP